MNVDWLKLAIEWILFLFKISAITISLQVGRKNCLTTAGMLFLTAGLDEVDSFIVHLSDYY